MLGSRASRRIDKNNQLGRFFRGFGFAESDDFDAFIVQLEILCQVLANHFCASLGQQTQLVAIALVARTGNDAEAKLIFFEVLSSIVQRFLILQLGVIRLIENFFGVIVKFLGGLPAGKVRDGVLSQFAGVMVPAFLEETAQKEIVLQ